MYEPIILCVDDEKMILDNLRSQLARKYGDSYILEFAESAREALEIVEDYVNDEHSFHAIISDWLMPGMKGDELLHEACKKLPQAKRMLLTGHVDEFILEKLRRDDECDVKCVFKPWKEEQIYTLIEG